MIEAKLKQEYRFPTANILGGVIYTKNEWTPVTPGMEKEALLPEYCLEVRVRPDATTIKAEELAQEKLDKKEKAKEARSEAKAEAKVADTKVVKDKDEAKDESVKRFTPFIHKPGGPK